MPTPTSVPHDWTIVRHKHSESRKPISSLQIQLKAHAELGDLQSAEAVLKEMDESGVERDAVTDAIMVKLFLTKKDYDSAQHLLSQTVQRKEFCLGLEGGKIILGLHKGQLRQLEQVWRKVEEFDNIRLWNGILTVVSSDARALREAWKRMNERIEPYATSYEITIKAAAALGDADFLMDVFERYTKDIKTPSPQLYTIVINRLAGLGKFEHVQKLWNSVAVQPDIGLYNTYLSIWAKRDHLPNVSRIWRQMQETGLKPDLFSYNILLGILCRRKEISKVQAVWKIIEDAGMVPDQATWNTVLHMLAENRDRVAAEKWFDRMEQKNKISCVIMMGMYEALQDTEAKDRVWRLMMSQHNETPPG
ncbi:pentatricopeptide repeat-containing protein [Planoprotostelium fungivorum]|uniref:Pentatricopeptide repeat-containing protein n=1 Tax=Planoprotostelium fungivorum TaxID=1890364 RepID=A0A2P6NUG3_9EUKA|nr:pentatricopeptide repeat-containing protein [Planoprotostelium fungivorum]